MTALMRNILRGAGSAFSIYPSRELCQVRFRNLPTSVEGAFKRDWEKIGQDFRGAVRTVRKSLPDVEK